MAEASKVRSNRAALWLGSATDSFVRPNSKMVVGGP
jgi:hypothetical protein